MTTFEITSPIAFYSENSKDASCTIKVGSIEGKINFYTSDAGLTTFKIQDNLQILLDAGMTLELNPLIDSYQLAVANQAGIIKASNYAKGLKYYGSCWLSKVVPPITSPATFSIESAEAFATRWSEVKYSIFPNPIQVSYRSNIIKIDYAREKGSFVAYDGPIGFGKKRYYKTFEQAAKKAVEIIDEHIEALEQAAVNKAKAAQAQNEKLNKLNLLFDGAVTSKKEWKSAYGSPARGYEATVYYVTKGDRKMVIEQCYADQFNFVGLTKLTADQVRKIIAIL